MNLKRDGEIHARLVEWNVKVCARINVTKRQIGNIVQWKLPFSIKKHVVHSLLVQSSVVIVVQTGSNLTEFLIYYQIPNWQTIF